MAAGLLCLFYFLICGVSSAPSLSENSLTDQQTIIMDDDIMNDDISANEMPKTAEELTAVQQRSFGDSFFKLTKPSEFIDALAAENPYNITTSSPPFVNLSNAKQESPRMSSKME